MKMTIAARRFSTRNRGGTAFMRWANSRIVSAGQSINETVKQALKETVELLERIAK